MAYGVHESAAHTPSTRRSRRLPKNDVFEVIDLTDRLVGDLLGEFPRARYQLGLGNNFIDELPFASLVRLEAFGGEHAPHGCCMRHLPAKSQDTADAAHAVGDLRQTELGFGGADTQVCHVSQ